MPTETENVNIEYDRIQKFRSLDCGHHGYFITVTRDSIGHSVESSAAFPTTCLFISGSSMKLTLLQRKILERYRQFRDQPPTLGRLVTLSLVNHILLIMVCGAAIACFAVVIADVSGMIFFVGLGMGAICRDIGLFRRTALAWPALHAIIDWKKLDEILAADSTDDQHPLASS